LEVRSLPTDELPRRRIEREGDNDLAIHPWPPRTPDVKDNVYVPPLPTDSEELKTKIYECP